MNTATIVQLRTALANLQKQRDTEFEDALRTPAQFAWAHANGHKMTVLPDWARVTATAHCRFQITNTIDCGLKIKTRLKTYDQDVVPDGAISAHSQRNGWKLMTSIDDAILILKCFDIDLYEVLDRLVPNDGAPVNLDLMQIVTTLKPE